MEHVGAQLGRTIERSRAERGLKAKNAQLRRLVHEADAQRRAAEAASHAKSAFLAVTSHEVRTPLNAVLGLAEALRREPLKPAQVEMVDEIVESGAMLLRLLNAVLDLSKIEAGKMTADLQPVDLRRAVQIVAGVWRARAEELRLTLNVDLSGLPDPCVVSTDEGKIEQTLVNLISNAFKFSPPDSTVTIRAATAEAGRIRIDVADEGLGVIDADLERIFQPFEQTDAGRAAGGAGLGLSICRGNMDLLGGDIGAEQAVRGSRFWFSFPAPLLDTAAAAPTPAETPQFDRPLRVLAAEDHPANRQVLRALLAPAGIELIVVENGREAVNAAVDQDFDLVLMDANMPVMSGAEAVSAIRALPGEIASKPIYMLTANAFEDDVQRYLAAGADAVLAKPVNLHALYEALANAAAKRDANPARDAA